MLCLPKQATTNLCAVTLELGQGPIVMYLLQFTYNYIISSLTLSMLSFCILTL